MPPVETFSSYSRITPPSGRTRPPDRRTTNRGHDSPVRQDRAEDLGGIRTMRAGQVVKKAAWDRLDAKYRHEQLPVARRHVMLTAAVRDLHRAHHGEFLPVTTADEVIRRIELYFAGGALSPLALG